MDRHFLKIVSNLVNLSFFPAVFDKVIIFVLLYFNFVPL